MKTKLLFVIESLNAGGAERSLVTLLNNLNYDKYDVDLQLFVIGGEFYSLVPKNVNILPTPTYFRYTSIKYSNLLRKISHPRYLISQIIYSLKIHIGHYNHTQEAVIFWKCCHSCFEKLDTTYDVAIAYAQGVPTFYVADKVKASKKIAWINAVYLPQGGYLNFISKKLKKYNYISCVSKIVYENFELLFSSHKHKAVIIKDLLSRSFILKMANMDEPFEYKDKDNILLSVGRLSESKGFDLAIEACKILIDRNFKFTWFVIGDGDQKQFLKDKIRQNHLDNVFILLGSKGNPYPYFKKCNYYVQTSKSEGFGLTIAEAKMFAKPIVTTDFSSINLQIKNNQNGLIVSKSPESIAEGIQKLFENRDMCTKFINNLKQEKIDNLEEIDKFYKLLDNNI